MKSSYCSSGQCVEVADGLEFVAVRDGKRPDDGVLKVSHNDWRGFLEGIQAGDFPR
ncbi:DUF397 domain-containing protein [Actinoplanes sp. NBRC 103695]|uniref:DUF397 domain-containing protein n=1 Tax=Actinoplanes sp. NBRC 103695 TaxID=3032202 RepID=UPI002552319F|nr:DUF397 domain-containing protein [Actinoplanes sp. NBRC 103695]